MRVCKVHSNDASVATNLVFFAGPTGQPGVMWPGRRRPHVGRRRLRGRLIAQRYESTRLSRLCCVCDWSCNTLPFLQRETQFPTWPSGGGDSCAGGLRTCMTTGGVGSTPIMLWCPCSLEITNSHSSSDHQGYTTENTGKKTSAGCMDANLILDLCPPRWFLT